MNKDDEWKLFRSVFGLNFDGLVCESEAPDFSISSVEGLTLGVEVTEVYLDSTEARLKYHEGYLASLLDGNGKVFRSDKGKMVVDEIKLLDESGEVRSTQIAVMRDVLKFDDAIKLVCDSILAKCKKVPAYLISCDAVDLIVNDSSGLFFIESDDDFHRFFFHKFDRNIVPLIKFREVFFICSLWGGRRIYMPLKLNLFLCDYLAVSVVIESELGRTWSDSEQDFDVLLLSLYEIGYQDFSYDIVAGNLFVDLGASIIEFTDADIIIKDHTSYLVPHEFNKSISKIRSSTSGESLEIARRVSARRWENIAHVPIYSPVADGPN